MTSRGKHFRALSPKKVSRRKRTPRCDSCGMAEGEERVGGDESGSKVRLKLCARCRKVTYCGTDCQRLAWRRHREVCAHSATPTAELPAPSPLFNHNTLDGAGPRSRRKIPAPTSASSRQRENAPTKHPFFGREESTGSLVSNSVVPFVAAQSHAPSAPVGRVRTGSAKTGSAWDAEQGQDSSLRSHAEPVGVEDGGSTSPPKMERLSMTRRASWSHIREARLSNGSADGNAKRSPTSSGSLQKSAVGAALAAALGVTVTMPPAGENRSRVASPTLRRWGSSPAGARILWGAHKAQNGTASRGNASPPSVLSRRESAPSYPAALKSKHRATGGRAFVSAALANTRGPPPPYSLVAHRARSLRRHSSAGPLIKGVATSGAKGDARGTVPPTTAAKEVRVPPDEFALPPPSSRPSSETPGVAISPPTPGPQKLSRLGVAEPRRHEDSWTEDPLAVIRDTSEAEDELVRTAVMQEGAAKRERPAVAASPVGNFPFERKEEVPNALELTAKNDPAGADEECEAMVDTRSAVTARQQEEGGEEEREKGETSTDSRAGSPIPHPDKMREEAQGREARSNMRRAAGSDCSEICADGMGEGLRSSTEGKDVFYTASHTCWTGADEECEEMVDTLSAVIIRQQEEEGEEEREEEETSADSRAGSPIPHPDKMREEAQGRETRSTTRRAAGSDRSEIWVDGVEERLLSSTGGEDVFYTASHTCSTGADEECEAMVDTRSVATVRQQKGGEEEREKDETSADSRAGSPIPHPDKMREEAQGRETRGAAGSDCSEIWADGVGEGLLSLTEGEDVFHTAVHMEPSPLTLPLPKVRASSTSVKRAKFGGVDDGFDSCPPSAGVPGFAEERKSAAKEPPHRSFSVGNVPQTSVFPLAAKVKEMVAATTAWTRGRSGRRSSPRPRPPGSPGPAALSGGPPSKSSSAWRVRTASADGDRATVPSSSKSSSGMVSPWVRSASSLPSRLAVAATTGGLCSPSSPPFVPVVEMSPAAKAPTPHRPGPRVTDTATFYQRRSTALGALCLPPPSKAYLGRPAGFSVHVLVSSASCVDDLPVTGRGSPETTRVENPAGPGWGRQARTGKAQIMASVSGNPRRTYYSFADRGKVARALQSGDVVLLAPGRYEARAWGLQKLVSSVEIVGAGDADACVVYNDPAELSTPQGEHYLVGVMGGGAIGGGSGGGSGCGGGGAVAVQGSDNVDDDSDSGWEDGKIGSRARGRRSFNNRAVRVRLANLTLEQGSGHRGAIYQLGRESHLELDGCNVRCSRGGVNVDQGTC
ncbi:unnamed protein product, partial [Ascophyllum nodosum]